MAEQPGGFTETYNAFMQEDEPTMELDLRDEIDKVLAEMVVLNRRKRRDYSIDGDPLSNFFRTAEIMRGKGYKGWDALTSVHAASPLRRPGWRRCASMGAWTRRRTNRCATP